jgi:hypothetical protein
MSYLRAYIFKHSVPGASMRREALSFKKSRKILIVEDNPINRKVLSLFLGELGYTHTIFAETGEEALTYFDHTIDLVLLDIGLPDTSGIEVCKKMRGILQGKPLPILAVTALSDDETNTACQLAGINKIVLKPVTMEILTETLNQWLH